MFFPASLVKTAFFPARTRGTDDIDGNFQLLNDAFFLYFEELDLAQRLRPEYNMRWCRNARVIHTGGNATGANGRLRSAKAEYFSSLSALTFTRVHFPTRLWIMIPARFIAKCVQLIFSGNAKYIRYVSRAYIDFITRRNPPVFDQ
jgi:GT2 family glycosyltransferase